MPLQRDAMIRAALALLDEKGLDGLTVRRLAQRLGVQNPALYWHFKNKQELLNAMAKAMVADAFAGVAPPATNDLWSDWLVDIADRFHRALLSHRDGARVVSSADLTGSELLDVQEMALRVLTTAGFDPRAALVSVIAIFDYTLGAAFEEQAEPDQTTWHHSRVSRPRHLALDPGRWPHLAAALAELTATAIDDPDMGFTGGIRLLLVGMAATKARSG